MERRPSARLDGSERLWIAARERLQHLDRARPDADRRVLLLYYKPVPNNPFQRLLYARCWNAGIAPVPVPALETLPELPKVVTLGAEVVLHLHWTAPVTVGSASADEARQRVDDFVAQVRDLKERGGRLLWTVHNAMPHECPYPDVELRLRRALAEQADAVHVLSAATRDAASAAGYELPPDRVHHVPHPSYLGAYPEHHDPLETRVELGLHPEAAVFGTVGAIRPYKGIPDLVDAFDGLLDEVGDRPVPPQLLVAGGGAAPELGRRLRTHPRVVTRLSHVPEMQMAAHIHACDVIALPYGNVLNSGALLLALSCGRPVVAPATGAVPEALPSDAGVTYDPDDPAGLRGALLTAHQELVGSAQARAAALARAEELAPGPIAERFAQLVLEMAQTAPSAR